LLHYLHTPLQFSLRLFPDAVHSQLLARAFNHAMRGQSLVKRLAELHGKRVCLRVTDTNRALYWRIDHGRLRPAEAGGYDVRISGSSLDFLRLATRAEDPDTLFFSRRLAIEGDTHTGLHMKNLLDALEFDWPAHFTAVLGARAGGVVTNLVERAKQDRRAQ
jgi:predicted lipid carrier protein YhbT